MGTTGVGRMAFPVPALGGIGQLPQGTEASEGYRHAPCHNAVAPHPGGGGGVHEAKLSVLSAKAEAMIRMAYPGTPPAATPAKAGIHAAHTGLRGGGGGGGGRLEASLTME